MHKRLPADWRPARSAYVDEIYSLVVGTGDRPAKPRRYHLLYRGAFRIARTFDLNEALEILESDMQSLIALSSPRGVFIHAGVVSWNDRAVVIPGQTLTGKTTLVSELVRAGATYYSDEYAALDRQGLVHSFRRPLVLRSGTNEDAAPCSCLGRATPRRPKPVPIGLILVAPYKAEARWRPHFASPAQGVMALLAHAIAPRSRPGVTLATLSRAVNSAIVVKGTRNEARDLVPFILQQLTNA